MSEISLGSQVVLGLMLGQVLHNQRSLRKHIEGCPVCTKRSKIPLASILSGLLVLGAGLLTGCKTTVIKGQIDGKPFVFVDRRCVMNSGAEMELPTTNGTLRFKVTSSPNAEALGAVAEGTARGVAGALKAAAK